MKLNKNVLSDRTLKIISLVIAIGLWLYVGQVQNPDIERTVKDVPVVFSQKRALEDKGLVLIDDNEHTIDIRIKGRRQYVYGVDSSTITVLADVGSLDSTGSHTLMTNVVLPYANLEIINKTPSVVAVTVDDLMEREFKVSVETEGTPKTDYIVGRMTSSLETITVKGPKSIVNGIEKVSAVVDVSSKTEDVALVSEFTVYGSNNKEIKSPYITLSESSAEVRCEILKTKTVNLIPVFAGDVSQAMKFLPDSNNTKTVKIAGAPEVIDDITEISTKPIEESEINSSGEASVELSLPTGVRSLDGDSFIFRFSPKQKQEE